jgi:hypothetical protein
MAPATAHFESDDSRQVIWRDSKPIRTTEPIQQEYPEAEIPTTVHLHHQDWSHSKNIPEARREMISGFPNPALATLRRKREYPSKMKQASTLQRAARAQASFHAPSDNEWIYANRPVQPIAGPSGVSMNTNLTFHRSGTGPAGSRAGRVPLLPMPAIHLPRQPAIADGGRSANK